MPSAPGGFCYVCGEPSLAPLEADTKFAPKGAHVCRRCGWGATITPLKGATPTW